MAKPWQGIVPLHSSRSDMYELLGNPTRAGKHSATFNLPNEIVEFIFAKGRSGQAESTPIFEQYGLISPDQENAILDNFAIQLLDDPNLTGKVILRRGQYSKKFAAKKLLRIKKYLYQHRHVHANRVSAFELSSGRDYTVELYLWSKAKRGSGPD